MILEKDTFDFKELELSRELYRKKLIQLFDLSDTL